jgi:hypothetical protein
LAIIAVAALALGAAPMIAQAQPAAAASAPKPYTKEQHDQGMKEAPAALEAAHVPCTLTDAAFLGKSGKSSVYEVACKEGMGYMIVGAADAATPAKAYDCLTTLGNASLTCHLPGNADPKQGLAPLVAAAGVTCALKDARSIGSTASGEAYYEIACQQGPGFILTKAPAGTTPAASAIPCIEAMGGSNVTCKLTTKAEIVASVAKIAAQSGKPCDVSDARFVGSSSTTGETFYEVACGTAAGFMIQTKAGAYQTAIDCANAGGIAGGCKMTDSTKAETDEAKTYTGLAKAGGFNCDVSKYRFIGMSANPKAEVVELACSSRPDGTVALFPVDPKIKPTFTDCVRSAKYGDSATCQLSSPTPVYAKFTAGLAAHGRTTCKVSGARYIGSAGGEDFIETACADGGPGWVIEFTPTDEVKSLLSCGQAKAQGLTCTLPTNVGK